VKHIKPVEDIKAVESDHKDKKVAPIKRTTKKVEPKSE
jgi:hypothetical protein